MIRNSLRFTSYKDRKQLVKDLRMIYTAATEEAAQTGLETFAGIWDSRYPQISQSWRDAWEQVIPYFAFPPALRRAVYTTNQIESLNASCAKPSASADTSPTTNPPASSSTSRSETTSATGNAPWPAGTNASPPSTPTSKTD